jgi:hypothetical protein
MKITEGKYFKFYERLEQLLDHSIKYLNHTILVDVFRDDISRFLDTDYLKFSLKKDYSSQLSLKICGFNEDNSIIFETEILRTENMRLLEQRESFNVFSDKFECSDIPMGEFDLFNDFDKKEDIVKIYKDFLRVSIFKFDEHYCDTKEDSNSSYLGDLNLLLNMMLLAPKDYHSQDYINNKSKLVIKLILSGDEIKQLFPEKVVTSVGNQSGRNFDFLYDIMIIKQENGENPFEDDFLVNSLLRMLNIKFTYFSFAFSKIKTLFEIWNDESYEAISVEKSKYPEFYDFIYKLKTKKDPNLKLFTYSGDIDFKVSDLDKIFTLKQ